MFERFTDRSRKVMALANQEAQRFNHECIGTEHILLGLVKEGSGVAASTLKNLGIDLRKVRLEVEKLVKSGPEMVTMGKLPQTSYAKKVLEYAIAEAHELNHNYVGTEHLLLGLLREEDGTACYVLSSLKVTVASIREEVTFLLGVDKVPVDLGISEELLNQLQKVADPGESFTFNSGEQQATQPVVAPFSFRFVRDEARYELLDGTGNVIDTKVFGGPVGAYLFNALRKHEKSQQILRDVAKYFEGMGFGLTTAKSRELLRQIKQVLDV